MRIEIDKGVLESALSKAARATNDRHNPAYAMVRLRTIEGRLEVSGMSGIVAVKTLATAIVEQEGDLGVNCKALVRSVSMMPAGPVRLIARGEQLLIQGGKREHRIPRAAGDFGMPLIPEPAEDMKRLPIEAGTLKRLVSRLEFACPGEKAAQRNGIVIEAAPDKGLIYACVIGDYNFSLLTQVYDGGGTWEAAMVPHIMISPLVEACEKTSEMVALYTDDVHVFLKTQDSVVVSLIPTNPLVEWRPIFARVDEVPLSRVGVEELTKAVRSVMVSSLDGVRLEFDGDNLLRVAMETVEGSAEDFLDVASNRAFGMKVDARNLIDPLSKCIGQEATVSTGSMSQLVLDDGAGFRSVIATMRDDRYDDQKNPEDPSLLKPLPVAKAAEAAVQQEPEQPAVSSAVLNAGIEAAAEDMRQLARDWDPVVGDGLDQPEQPAAGAEGQNLQCTEPDQPEEGTSGREAQRAEQPATTAGLDEAERSAESTEPETEEPAAGAEGQQKQPKKKSKQSEPKKAGTLGETHKRVKKPEKKDRKPKDDPRQTRIPGA